ncbi:hypothetical protein J4Q44_G00020090 [Coregonus suidteri]|uniref:Uncharacterized protein n=1 Tax=Coregonus suidteri TaxID=861788 RepID=A0AAN8MB36_9TELE
MLGVDLIGTFMKSRNGNSWCPTVTDHFTKWVEAIPIKDEPVEATSKAMMDIFNTHSSPEVILSDRGHEHWNKTDKTAMGKSLDWYQEGWANNLKVILFAHNSSIQASTEYRREPQLLTEINETPPDVVEVVEPDQNAFEDHLQAWTEKDVEVFDQVRLNMDKAQEKQKESYRSRIKKGTKCYDIRANYLVWKKDETWETVTSVEANNLRQLEQLDGRPLKALTPYTSVKLNRQRPSTVRAPRRYPVYQNQT